MAVKKSASITLFLSLVTLTLALALGSCAIRPTTRSVATQEGLASYYSNDFQGRKTSSGEIFDNKRFTAAHRTYPFGTLVRVTNLETDVQVTVRINDRGPVKPERVIDLTYAAAKQLGIVRSGLGHVRLDVLEWGKQHT
jgi:rare lipoprotein A